VGLEGRARTEDREDTRRTGRELRARIFFKVLGTLAVSDSALSTPTRPHAHTPRQNKRLPAGTGTDTDNYLTTVTSSSGSGVGRGIWMPNNKTAFTFQRAKLCPDISNVFHSGFKCIFPIDSLFTTQSAGPG
jgi:hypothetical protein